MDCKRYLIPTLAVFVAMSLTEMGIHLGCLAGVYEELEASGGPFRSQEAMQQFLWLQPCRPLCIPLKPGLFLLHSQGILGNILQNCIFCIVAKKFLPSFLILQGI